jgi:hypothetical protein
VGFLSQKELLLMNMFSMQFQMLYASCCKGIKKSVGSKGNCFGEAYEFLRDRFVLLDLFLCNSYLSLGLGLSFFDYLLESRLFVT